MHRRSGTAVALSTLVTALAAVLSGAAPAQAALEHRAVTTQASAARTIQDLVTSDVRHTPVTKTGGAVRERLVIDLHQRATVTNLWVYHRLDRGRVRAVRGPVNLGSLSPGRHSWTWAGHDNRGRRVPDGYYEVRGDISFAYAGTQQGRVFGVGFVHRHYHPGDVTSQYPTIYPRSKAILDSTTLVNRRPYPSRATMRVTNRLGKTVFTRAIKAQRTSMRVRWDGRDARGRALPRGAYYVKVFGVDQDGLRGSSRARRVVVSGQRLVTTTRTVTLSPTASRTNDYPVSCNGCGDFPVCGKVVPSERFAQAGALSYRSGTGESCEPGRWVAFTRHVRLLSELAPRGGEMSVSVFGGPTTPGASDQGQLAIVSNSQTTTVRTGPDTSDHTTTTPWVPISGPEVADRWGEGAEWLFSTREGSSYDAASFSVRFRFLSPRS